MEAIGDKVKRMLEERGWTQEDFEEKSGISQAFISQIIRDETAGVAWQLDCCTSCINKLLNKIDNLE